MNQPKVSIVMPSLNVRPYITQCIESAINQTLTDIEIICVDAGSTDGTLEILKEYERKDSRVKVLVSDIKSYGRQVNIGFDEAVGEYFAILETDDIIAPTMYEELSAVADIYDVDIVKADFFKFEEKNGLLKKERGNICGIGMYNRVLNMDRDRDMVMRNNPIYTWSGIYRMDFLRENEIRHNETPGASYQDNGFWFQTMCMAKDIYFYQKPFYHLRRDNPNSSAYNKTKVYIIGEEYDFILSFLKKHEDVYKENISYYWRQLYGAYLFTYNRVSAEYKKEFADFYREALKRAEAAGELNRAVFKNDEWHRIKMILSGNYHNYMNLKAKRRKMPQTSINRLKWCYEDNGLKYTVRHIFSRLKNKLIKKKPTVSYNSGLKNTDLYKLQDEIHSVERNILVQIELNKRKVNK